MNNGQWKTINNDLKNTTHIINDRITLKTEGELLEKVSRTCSPVTPVELFLLQTLWYAMNEERTWMWSFFTHIFLSGLSSNDGHCKTVEVMPPTLPQGNIGSIASLLAATLYNGNPDRNRTPISGIAYQLRHVYIYFRTRFLLILDIQYFSLFFLF